MPQIFISYRREDSEIYAHLLFKHLSKCLGKENIFMDVDTIPLGVDFVKTIEQSVEACDVMIVLIGKKWLRTRKANQRRLDDPKDFVRLELKAALNGKLLIIPALVDGAKMPKPEELPEDISKLVDYQGLEIRGRDYSQKFDQLTRDIERAEARRKEEEEKHKQAEAKRRLEQEKRHKTEQKAEKERQEELEAQLKAEVGRKRQKELEAKRKAEAERKRQEDQGVTKVMTALKMEHRTAVKKHKSVSKPSRAATRVESEKGWSLWKTNEVMPVSLVDPHLLMLSSILDVNGFDKLGLWRKRRELRDLVIVTDKPLEIPKIKDVYQIYPDNSLQNGLDLLEDLAIISGGRVYGIAWAQKSTFDPDIIESEEKRIKGFIIPQEIGGFYISDLGRLGKIKISSKEVSFEGYHGTKEDINGRYEQVRRVSVFGGDDIDIRQMRLNILKPSKGPKHELIIKNKHDQLSDFSQGLIIPYGYLSPYLITEVDTMSADHFDDTRCLLIDEITSYHKLVSRLSKLAEHHIVIFTTSIDLDSERFFIINKLRGTLRITLIVCPKNELKKLSSYLNVKIFTEEEVDEDKSLKNLAKIKSGTTQYETGVLKA